MNGSPLQYARSKLLQARFALAALCNRTGVYLLHRAQRLISPHFYAFEPEKYTAELVQLQRIIAAELKAQKREYRSLRYSFGYPYQGLSTLGVFGARSTEDRWRAYGLANHILASDTILDIGCNCGFMSLYSVYRTGCRADAIDINPYMLNIGRHCAGMLDIEARISFINADFREFNSDRTYSKVYSFAAHHTEDKQHTPDLRAYFERIHSLLTERGVLVFESHGYDSDDPTFQARIRSMTDLFSVLEQKSLFNGNRELFFLERK